MVKLMEEIKKISVKKSIQNGIWMYLLQFFNAIVPLLTLPYVTRILGSAQYGIFSIAFNIISYMQVIVEYGFGMSATRKVVLAEDGNINELFSAVIYARSVLMTVCFMMAGLFVVFNQKNVELCCSLLLLLICLLGYCMQVNWLFQGKQEMKYISLVNIISRLISVVCIFTFVKTSSNILLYCLLYSISPFLSGCIGLIIAKKMYKLHFVRLPFKRVREEFRDGWYVFTTQLSSKIFGSIGITFLSIFVSNSEVGIFSAIQKIPNIIMLAWTPVAQVLYPISSKHLKDNFEDGKKFVYRVRRKVLPVYTLITIIVCIFSKTIIQIVFGDDYIKFYYWVIPLLIWIIVAINNNFLGIQLLLGSGYDKEYSKCFQVSVLSTILFNFILIYFVGGDGAAIAPLISELTLFILLIVNIRKISKIEVKAKENK